MITHMLEDCMRNDEYGMRHYHELTHGANCYYFNTSKYLSRLPVRRGRCKYLGELCSICLQGIYSLSTGWITACNHVFHKKCLRQWCVKTNCRGTCPECRNDMGCVEFTDGIRFVFPFQNCLDQLEEVDNILHHVCHDCDGILGMTQDCCTCARYLETGRCQ